MSDEVTRYYDSADEAGRLEQDVFRLEAERTRELLGRFLPPPPLEVADVGGGAGAYAFWLAERGHAVRLLDLSPGLVETARRRGEAAPSPLVEAIVGDARRLPWPEASLDAVLLLGPLYHLTRPEQRQGALGEAARVLRSGGRLLAAGISRFASLLDGLRLGLVDDPGFRDILAGDLRDGCHRNPGRDARYFTTAFFHRPEELREEVTAAGFEVEAVVAVEGPGWLAPDFDARWRDSTKRSQLLEWVRSVEAEPALLGASAHILAAARKP